MSDKTFYVTTPIYYTNGIPHIGHAYSSIICDVLARYNKINGKKVKFSTGVDENSQKALLKAQEEGMEIMPYLDLMASKHKAVWDGLNIKYTDFIRTTEERHHKLVREVLQKCYDNGDIYQAEYEGMYCVGCEAFKKDDDLIEKDGKKVCPDHLTEPQKIKEKNWFFRLSKYEDFLKNHYKNNPNFVIPDNRFNEVKAFVDRGLEDFSISRETNKFGIRLPFDESQVTYVWFDALFNYVTVCKYPDNGGDDSNFWPADLHVVAKDIIRFHAIYWPAMLESSGYELPKQVLTTGYFTVDGQKISKSLGNVIDPVEFSAKYSKDLLTLYMLSCINIGQDGDFDQKQAILTYNAKLANNLGNLVNRVVVLSLKIGGVLEGKMPISVSKMLDYLDSVEYFKDVNNLKKLPLEVRTSFELYIDWPNAQFGKFKNGGTFISEFYRSISKYNLKESLDISFEFLDNLNDFTTQKEPWQTIKDETKLEETKEVLYTIAEGLRQVGLALYPFFPEKMSEMFKKLGLENYIERLENGELLTLIGETPTFEIKEKGENLFNRLEV